MSNPAKTTGTGPLGQSGVQPSSTVADAYDANFVRPHAPALTRLVRHPAKDRADDIDRMLAVLHAKGFDASRGDLEAAYRAWSEKHTGSSWHGLTYLDDAKLYEALRNNLDLEDASCVS